MALLLWAVINPIGFKITLLWLLYSLVCILEQATPCLELRITWELVLFWFRQSNFPPWLPFMLLFWGFTICLPASRSPFGLVEEDPLCLSFCLCFCNWDFSFRSPWALMPEMPLQHENAQPCGKQYMLCCPYSHPSPPHKSTLDAAPWRLNCRENFHN